MICMCESGGYLDCIGPFQRDPVTKKLYVKLAADGKPDVSAWQHHGATEGMTAIAYAQLAYSLWRQRGWSPWVAYKRHSETPQRQADWDFFTELVNVAADSLAMPQEWVDAAKDRR